MSTLNDGADKIAVGSVQLSDGANSVRPATLAPGMAIALAVLLAIAIAVLLVRRRLANA
jgi:X-X-X-Leu-X-X-Gly heptad repeat protein